MGVLVALTRPYRGRTCLAIGALLAAILTALAPPYLAKLAIDQGIREDDLSCSAGSSPRSSPSAVLNWGASVAQTY